MIQREKNCCNSSSKTSMLSICSQICVQEFVFKRWLLHLWYYWFRTRMMLFEVQNVLMQSQGGTKCIDANSGCYVSFYHHLPIWASKVHVHISLKKIYLKILPDLPFYLRAQKEKELFFLVLKVDLGNCYFLVFLNACPNLTFNCSGQSGNLPKWLFYLHKKKRSYFLVLKANLGNCYFLVFLNAYPNLTFTCPGQSSKC